MKNYLNTTLSYFDFSVESDDFTIGKLDSMWGILCYIFASFGGKSVYFGYVA